MPVAALVDFCGLFDIAPGTVRTTLSRMVDRGELTTDDASYALERPTPRPADTNRTPVAHRIVGRMGRRLVRGDRRPPNDASATDRRDFRSRAIGRSSASCDADIWMRPANIDDPDRPRRLRSSRAARSRAPTARRLAAPLWDLPSIDGGVVSDRTDLDRAADATRPSRTATACRRRSSRSPSRCATSASSRSSPTELHSPDGRRRTARDATTTSSGASATNCRHSSAPTDGRFVRRCLTPTDESVQAGGELAAVVGWCGGRAGPSARGCRRTSGARRRRSSPGRAAPRAARRSRRRAPIRARARAATCRVRSDSGIRASSASASSASSCVDQQVRRARRSRPRWPAPSTAPDAGCPRHRRRAARRPRSAPRSGISESTNSFTTCSG